MVSPQGDLLLAMGQACGFLATYSDNIKTYIFHSAPFTVGIISILTFHTFLDFKFHSFSTATLLAIAVLLYALAKN